jgi:hypothetical protein
LDLPWRICIARLKKGFIDLILAGIVFPIHPDWLGGVGDKLAGGIEEAIVADLYPFVGAIGYVERLDEKIQLRSRSEFQVASNAKIGAEVIRTGECIPAIGWQAVIVGVSVAIRVACDGGVEPAPRSESDDAGQFLVIE